MASLPIVPLLETIRGAPTDRGVAPEVESPGRLHPIETRSLPDWPEDPLAARPARGTRRRR